MHCSGLIIQTKHKFLLDLCSVMIPPERVFLPPPLFLFFVLPSICLFFVPVFVHPLDISFSYAAHPLLCLSYNTCRLVAALPDEYTPYSTTKTKGVGHNCCWVSLLLVPVVLCVVKWAWSHADKNLWESRISKTAEGEQGNKVALVFQMGDFNSFRGMFTHSPHGIAVRPDVL